MDDVADNLRLVIEKAQLEDYCPACEGSRPRGYALCRRCWRGVPAELKRWVRRAAARGTWEEWVDAMCGAIHALEVNE